MIDFSTHLADDNETLIIRVGGHLDAESNEYFFQCVQDEIDKGHHKIVINCCDLGYVSSVGLGALVRARSRVAKAGGTIYLSRIESKVLDALRLVGFDRLFNIYETEHEALAAMASVS